MVFVVIGGWLVLAAFVIGGWSRIATSGTWRNWALLLTLGFSLVHQLLFATVADDSFVTFRYARDIAEGYGPVFNPGERVEGYSSFLWLIVVAMPKVLFGWDIVVTAVVFSVLCALGAVLFAYLLVNRIVTDVDSEKNGQALGVLAAVLTACSSGLAAYGPSGLETPLFVLLLLGTTYALSAHRPVVAGVLVTMVVMTRPEGVLIAVLGGLWLLADATRKRQSWWAPVGYVLGSLVFAVPWTAWRVTYYGHLLPNPLVAKLGAPFGWLLGQGWRYVSSFGLAQLGFLLLALATLAMLLSRRSAGPHESQGRATVWFLLALAAVMVVGTVAVGGDAAPAWRALASIPPLLVVAALAAYGAVTASVPSPSPRRIAAVALVLSGISVFVSVAAPNFLTRTHEWRTQVAQSREIGTWLENQLAPRVISSYSSGALAYELSSQTMVVDVRGLTDEVIAREGTRNARDGYVPEAFDYVVNGRRPSLAVATIGGYSDRQSCGIDPNYAGRYQVASFRREGKDQWVTLYLRSDQAATMIAELGKDLRFEYLPCPG